MLTRRHATSLVVILARCLLLMAGLLLTACDRAAIDTTSSVGTGQAKQRLVAQPAPATLSDLPFLKFIFNSEQRLHLKQDDLPKRKFFRGGIADEIHHVKDIDWDGSSFDVGEIHGNVAGFSNLAASATAYGGRDWLAWSDGDRILVKELAPGAAPTGTTTVRTAPVSITSAPSIIGFNGKLVVVWAEQGRIHGSRSVDGRVWSQVEILRSTEFDYGPTLTLSSFQGDLYVSYVLSGRSIYISRIFDDFSGLGLTFGVYEAASPLLDKSVSVATYEDRFISFAFTDSAGQVAVLHADHLANGAFQGPFDVEGGTTEAVGKVAIAYGALRPNDVRLYFAVPRANGFGLLVKPVSELLSDGALGFVFDTVPTSGRHTGFLFNSAYPHESADNALGLTATLSDCTRDVQLNWNHWLAGKPHNLERFDVLINGRPRYFPSSPEASASGFTPWVVPHANHAFQVIAVLNDGKVIRSNEAPYRFEPCTHARTLRVAVVRTKIDVGPPSTFALDELEDMFFGEEGSVAALYADTSAGNLTLTGSVFARDDVPVPGKVDDYCVPLGDGWGTACSGVPVDHIRDTIPGDFDVFIYLIGGVGNAGDTGGNRIRLSGRYNKTEASAVHELGHVLGLEHSSAWACPGATLVGANVFDTQSSACRPVRYSDFLEPQGGRLSIGVHFSAFHGLLLGYIEPEQSTTVTQSSTLALKELRRASSGGVVELRVPLENDVNTFYTIEYHRDEPLGAGQCTIKNIFDCINDEVHGLLVRLHSTGVLQQNSAGGNEFLLIEHLVRPGEPFVDPYRGVRIELLQFLENDRAEVRIEFFSALLNPAFSGGERLDWTDGNGEPLALSTASSTLGGSSFVVPGAGQNTLLPPVLDTRKQTLIGDKLAVDVFVPSAQANPNSVGSLQLTVSVPSAGIVDKDLGSHALTPLGRDAWSILAFDVDAELARVLGQFHDDVQFELSMTLISNEAPTLIDNFRFRDNIRTARSCSDGLQNGDETDVDCGGSCQACPMDDACVQNSDCAGTVCSEGVCACPPGVNVLMGTQGADTLVGTSGRDCIVGLAGADQISGGSGDDVIRGGSGDDTINGGPGNDTIFGGDGADTIDSGSGNDVIVGGGGVDTCAGGAGVNAISCEVAAHCTAACCATHSCESPSSGTACGQPYAGAACASYSAGTVVSVANHNWECTNGNCANCATHTSCAPGATGCPWGVVWTDRGPCE